jgi:serine/threonine protein kinase
MEIRIDDVKEAICKQFQENPESIKTLGRKDRPNSWTFFANFKNEVKSVIKVIKPARGEEILLQSEEEALRILNGITEIILQLAEENIIHQDIKPANIMLMKSSNDVLLTVFIFSSIFILLH